MTEKGVTLEGWIAAEIGLPSGISEDDARVDILSSELFDLGCAGLEVRDQEDRLVIAAAFAPEHADPSLAELIERALALAAIEGAELALKGYAPIDWATHWRQHFHAICFGAAEGESLWVVPTWLEPPVGARHVIRIDPSSAFGTGLHATTALCLEALLERSPIDAVLDVGTGTGILALAALELGSRRAVATDNDPEALRVAEENAALNNLAGRLVLSASDPAELGERFDVVVANILARPLLDLAPQLKEAVKPGGAVVLSGITAIQAADVVEAYTALGFVEPVVTAREEWVRVVLEAPADRSRG